MILTLRYVSSYVILTTNKPGDNKQIDSSGYQLKDPVLISLLIVYVILTLAGIPVLDGRARLQNYYNIM